MHSWHREISDYEVELAPGRLRDLFECRFSAVNRANFVSVACQQHFHASPDARLIVDH
jgi:hypothetical protein